MKSRLQILTAQTRKFTLHADTDLEQVAAVLPDEVTGADISAVTSSAFSRALQRKLAELRAQAIEALGLGLGRDTSIRTSTGSSDSVGESGGAGGSTSIEACVEDDWKIRSYINKLTRKQLIVTVQQEDFMYCAARAKPAAVDLEYYKQLGERYDDTGVLTNQQYL
jgi:SpoVK/Ycf46/Vps4 family AAA+-type ATPase